MPLVNPYIAAGIATVLAYLIGGLPSGYLFVLFSSGKDVRKLGSGNIGATNVHRTVGGKAGLIVLALDILKGFLAVWLAGLLSHSDAVAMALAAVAVMLGHSYPVFLRFRGGKAVACFVGAFALLAPIALTVTLLLFIIVVAFTKYVSLGSIVAAILFPITVWLFDHPAQPIFIASIFAALLILYRHHSNIFRLLHGEEHLFSLKGGSLKGDSA